MLLVVLALVSAVAAQTTTAGADIPPNLGITPCILQCVQPAATANGCSFTDPQCVCTSAQFQADATQCLNENCTPAEVQAALALQQSQCGNTTPNTGTPGPRPNTGTSTSASAATTPDGSSSTTGTAPAASNTGNAAAASVVGGTWAVAVGLLGVAVAL